MKASLAASTACSAEMKYKEVGKLPVVEREASQAEVSEATSDGWIGFTDHFWLTSLIPEQGKPVHHSGEICAANDTYQTETRQPIMAVAPGATAQSTTRLFAGAEGMGNHSRTIRMTTGIAGFINSIDWGWFFFLTKPIFAVLHWLNAQIGNMGIAIIALTFLLKALVLPLAYKSYVSMARMKELQPEMEKLREKRGRG